VCDMYLRVLGSVVVIVSVLRVLMSIVRFCWCLLTSLCRGVIPRSLCDGTIAGQVTYGTLVITAVTGDRAVSVTAATGVSVPATRSV